MSRSLAALARGRIGVLALAALVFPASASAAPHIVVWSGGNLPTSAAVGVEISASGSARTIDPAGRERRLAVSRRQLARIRAAAGRVLDKHPANVSGGALDGGYVSAFIQDGARFDAVVDAGRDSAPIAELVASLPRPAGIRPAGPSQSKPPSTAPCEPGKTPTEITQEVPMGMADAAHLVKASPKGPIAGDNVKVEARWQRFPELPVNVTVHIEINHQPGDTHPWAPDVKQVLDRAYHGAQATDGGLLTFTFDVVDRAPGAPPRPCFHEVVMHPKADVRSNMSDFGPKQLTGDWEAKESWAWPHEVGHALGLKDQYVDYFVFKKPGHPDIPLPENATPAEIKAAIGPRFSLKDGKVVSKSNPGTGDDLMAAVRNGRLAQAAVDLLARSADLVIYAVPGEILLNKDVSAQNLVVGAPFEIRVPPNQIATREGMVSYCIDLHRNAPYDNPGFGMDTLGRAGDLGGPALTALQRVVDVIAARQPGPLMETPGANEAIWRVTDDEPPSDDDAAAWSILAAAGITDDMTFNAPHFDDPAAGTPDTVQLVPGGGIAPAPVTAPPATAPPAPSVSAVTVSPRRVHVPRGGGPALLSARVAVTGGSERVSVMLVRGGRVVAHGQSSAEGLAFVILRPRRLRPGAYRVIARGADGSQRVASLIAR